MKENKFTAKSQNRSKTIRMLHRKQMFQKKRELNSKLSYQNFYDPQTWAYIKDSLQQPIPSPLPPLSRETISFYRRNGNPVFKTRAGTNNQLDPHMTFESLWSLAGKQQIEEYTDYQYIIKDFQQQFKTYISSPFSEIREMAIIAAGNKILGKQEDILNIVKNDSSQLWILVNHILERKISFKYLFHFLDESNSIIFCTIFEMTNNEKDQINDFIVSHEEILGAILKCVQSKNNETQSYAIRIIGNILAEKEDYAGIMAHYNILNVIFPVLKSPNKDVRRDACWLIGNYTFQKAPANQTLCKSNIMARLCSMLKDETYVNAKIELYYIFTHLISLGDKNTVYSLIKEEKILESCSNDIEIIDNTQLCYIILQLINEIIEVGEEFVDYEQDTGNQFINIINHSQLRKSIHSKTFYSNDQISSISFEILDKLNVQGSDFLQ